MSKSYLAAGNTKTITIQGEEVVIQKFSYATQKRIATLSQGEDTNASIDAFLLASIQSWTLKDEGDQPLAIVIENINLLASEFITELVKACTDYNNISETEVKN